MLYICFFASGAEFYIHTDYSVVDKLRSTEYKQRAHEMQHAGTRDRAHHNGYAHSFGPCLGRTGEIQANQVYMSIRCLRHTSRLTVLNL